MESTSTQYPTPAVPLSEHPASLPKADIAADVDHACIALSSVSHLRDLSEDYLAANAIWRDTHALTGTFRTFFGPRQVSTAWKERCDALQTSDFLISPSSSRIVRLESDSSWVEANFTFRTHGRLPSQCSGTVGLVPLTLPDGTTQWKIWLLITILERVDGWPDVDTIPSHPSVVIGATQCVEHVDCLVAGGASSGLCMAGRLQSIGVSYLVVERQDDLGHSWLKNRYESLKLHTSKDFGQLPGKHRIFGPETPYNMRTGCLVDGFQRYIDMYHINIKFSTELVAATWDQLRQIWNVELITNGAKSRMTARHVVLAVGGDGVRPSLPELPNRDSFSGDVIHGGEWRNGAPWKGKSGIIVGSANTAQGLMADMARAEFRSITMVQRSRTFLFPIKTFSGLVDPVYNSEIPTEKADRMSWGYPLALQRLMAMIGIRQLADQNKEYFDRIEAQGFDAERYGDLWGLMYSREGGHFFDLGSGELIANGTVQVRSKVEPVAYTSTGLKLSDGTCVDGDVIVFATGYTPNMRRTAIRIFGEEIGNSLQEFWHCNEEGEIRGAWKYIGHPGLWYTGHGLALARYYSRFVAMQIKADVEGQPFEIYTDTPNA